MRLRGLGVEGYHGGTTSSGQDCKVTWTVTQWELQPGHEKNLWCQGEASWGHHQEMATCSPATDLNNGGQQDSTPRPTPHRNQGTLGPRGPQRLLSASQLHFRCHLGEKKPREGRRLKNQRHSTLTEVTITLVSGYS